MSLTTAQKHDLIIAFNQNREDTYSKYQMDKTVRKDEEQKTGTSKAKT